MMRVADSSSGKPLALDDVQSKPWTFSIKRNRAEIGYSRKFRRTKDGIISSSLRGVQTGDKLSPNVRIGRRKSLEPARSTNMIR